MKKNPMKALSIASGLAVLLTMSTLNTSTAETSDRFGARIEGAWDVQVSITDCQNGNVIRTFPP